MRPGLTISCVGHAAALVIGLVAISAHPMEATPTETLPVEFISAKDFSKLTQGVKTAPPKKEPTKPLADKVGELRPATQATPKVADKPEVATEAAAPPPQPKPAVKPAEKPAEHKTDDFKPDQIADLLHREAAKKPQKTHEQPAPQKPAHQTPVFDASQVAALLDHRAPQRHTASAEAVNSTPALGAATGTQDAQLSQSEIDALRARLSQCWSPPAGIDATTKIFVTFRVFLKPDGSLAQPPTVVEGSASPLGPALAESARRALLMCQPFTMLKPEHYDQWKDLQIDFNPQLLLGG